jgi:hypothetical protein
MWSLLRITYCVKAIVRNTQYEIKKEAFRRGREGFFVCLAALVGAEAETVKVTCVQYSATYRRRQPDSELSEPRASGDKKNYFFLVVFFLVVFLAAFFFVAIVVLPPFILLTVRMSKMRVNAFLRAMKKFCEECVAIFAVHEANFSYVTHASLVRARVARKIIF